MYTQLVLAAAVAGAAARKITVVNECSYTVWPAIFTDPSTGKSIPSQATGWEQASGATKEFEVPDDWTAGRIWGRKDCDFSKPELEACSAGNCNGGLECASAGGTGVPPVTVAEWTFGTDAFPVDAYDVSVVDGFNIPMSVTNSVGCPVADCPTDINESCPDELALTVDGKVAGCKSACSANLDGNKENSPNCCSGQYNVPATCPKDTVQYYDVFKSACKNSYVYAYDESSETALWYCDVSKKADYTVTFCPDGSADNGNQTSSPSAGYSSTGLIPASSALSTSASSASVPAGSSSPGTSETGAPNYGSIPSYGSSSQETGASTGTDAPAETGAPGTQNAAGASATSQAAYAPPASPSPGSSSSSSAADLPGQAGHGHWSHPGYGQPTQGASGKRRALHHHRAHGLHH